MLQFFDFSDAATTYNRFPPKSDFDHENISAIFTIYSICLLDNSRTFSTQPCKPGIVCRFPDGVPSIGVGLLSRLILSPQRRFRTRHSDPLLMLHFYDFSYAPMTYVRFPPKSDIAHEINGAIFTIYSI